MNVEYVPATPELKRRMEEQSTSNASDFIRFEDRTCSVIALVDGEPIGLIVAKLRPLGTPLGTVQEAYIDVIEVGPAYQRRGIGTALVKEAIAWARDNGASQVRAWSEEVRHEALMLWNKLGFTFSQVDWERGDSKGHGFYVAKRL